MEQRIGSSSRPLKNEPVTGAGFDPAFIPGLTPPAAADPADGGPGTEPEETPSAGAGKTSSAAGPQDAAPEAEAKASDAGEADAEAAAQSAEDAGPEAEVAPDGPVFEAADRRARIVADHRGVRLSLDDQECEFRWDEIGAVETETPRFGKRFTVTVHTPERRWYPIEIEAPARSRFAEWEARLDAVLDAYFEDEEPAAADADQNDAPTAEGEASPKDEASPKGETSPKGEAPAAEESSKEK
ncbi:hypothetical protein ACF1BS_18730 [Streptomyces sp. NPDC014748]|uniref:hypothetical protein n=1 Tax=Streptomyces sp. NPDC014748 TaxID=3364905 RepID=UPI0036FDAA33